MKQLEIVASPTKHWRAPRRRCRGQAATEEATARFPPVSDSKIS